ncbi:zinc finger protein 25-like [Bradysia coprophila]|uniref:zinc finger protein 25-like n=1 Tax=Bradysia coprophila TaxID=38358 RepID=UPI00187D85CE|nr:zinc finger protein 25-like [Bradysia coprophila]
MSYTSSYTDFVALIKENTNNKLDDYKGLCRFCLGNQSQIFDMGDANCYTKQQQRDAISNNYFIVTKQYLPIFDEYPNFVCSSCEANLSLTANFLQNIKQNAENWEIFLKSSNEVKVQMEEGSSADGLKHYGEFDAATIKAIEDIKMEFCDVSVDYVLEKDTSDALEPPLFKIEAKSENVEDVTATAKRVKRKWKTTRKPTSTYMNPSTEFERTCQFCDQPTFPSMNRLYSHRKLSHPEKKICGCDICGAGFTNKNTLFIHMKDRHAKCGRKHQCQFCAKLFHSDREVKLHEKRHLNVRSYVCNLCGKGFNSKSTLNSHLKSKVHNANYKPKKQHPKDNQPNHKTYRCDQCVPSTIFASSEERTNHRNAMHKIYECDVCKNLFLTLESLDSHKLVHSNKPRPFVCSVCNATFSQSSHLSSHFKCKHTNAKSFQCTMCDKQFVENFALTAHTNLVHKKQARVKCNQCEADFASIRYLQMHTLAKHSIEAALYDCKICGKKNGCAATLKRHRLRHHKLME